MFKKEKQRKSNEYLITLRFHSPPDNGLIKKNYYYYSNFLPSIKLIRRFKKIPNISLYKIYFYKIYRMMYFTRRHLCMFMLRLKKLFVIH